jgi:epsilon-lactone hydrolase
MRNAVVSTMHDRSPAFPVTLVGMDDQSSRQEGKVLPLPAAPDAIELRHLRAFAAVAEELNFARAASRLFLSPPALSRQIRMLERLIGCELLRRTTHRVELTLAGEALLDRAGKLLTDLDDAVQRARTLGGESSSRATQLWAPTRSFTSTNSDMQDMRNAYEALLGQFSAPPEIQVRSVNAAGVPSLLLSAQSDQPADLLYLHGGGYVAGSAFGLRPLAGAIAAAADTTVVVPEYRLAPEHPFPAAVEDARRAYRWMLGQGVAPHQVAVCGDSSGAGLALSLLVSLKEQDEPMPGGAVLMCPALTLQQDRPRSDAVPLFSDEQMRRFADCYLAGHPDDDPLVAPLAADLSGLPPLLIQAATNDPMLVDARRLADHARHHGVEVTLELYPVATHVFQIFWSFLPEAADAVQKAATAVTQVRQARPESRANGSSS